MPRRLLVSLACACSILSAAAWGDDKPSGAANPGPNPAPIAAAVSREASGLSAPDFSQREEALQHLQTLVADQLKQRAQIQDLIASLQADLEQQQRALAMVSGQEAQAQIAGLLEMERGLTGWTMQVMSETTDRRKTLLNWGLTAEMGPILAHVYGTGLRARVAGIAQLAKLKGDNVDWTLGRLVNDREAAVRAAAMAACWSRDASPDIVNALWYRAVSGPQVLGDNGPNHQNVEGRMMMETEGMDLADNAITVEFPGGEAMEFDDQNDAAQFFDAELASDVLVHLSSPLVEQKVKGLVAERTKIGKTLSLDSDPDWTLVTHRLVEVYKVKEALPLLAAEALGPDTDDMDGEYNGRTFAWSRRSMAIGAIAKLIGKDPADLNIFRARDMGDPRGWMWGVELSPQQAANGVGEGDGPAVRAFYAFWKDHHAEYGVAAAPNGDNVPKPGQAPGLPVPMPGRFRGRPIPLNVPIGPAVPPEGPPQAPVQEGAAG